MAYEQQVLFQAKPDKCCDTCERYSALNVPRERSDGAIIYGYCFKMGDENHSPNMGKGYPVFIDGAVCKAYKKASKTERRLSCQKSEMSAG